MLNGDGSCSASPPHPNQWAWPWTRAPRRFWCADTAVTKSPSWESTKVVNPLGPVVSPIMQISPPTGVWVWWVICCRAGPASIGMWPRASAWLTFRSKNSSLRYPYPMARPIVRGVAVGPDGRWAFVAHTHGRVNLPTSQLERGWVNTNALTVIDLKQRRRYVTLLLDTVQRRRCRSLGSGGGTGRADRMGNSGGCT